MELAALHVHIVHVEQIVGKLEPSQVVHVELQTLVVFLIGEIIDIFDLADGQNGPFALIEGRFIGQLFAGESLCLEGDGQVEADLDGHGTGVAAVAAFALAPAQMVVEITPHLCIGADLGRQTERVELEGENTDFNTEFHACADADGTHDVEVKLVVCFGKVDRFAGGITFKDHDREAVALGDLIFKGHTDGDIQVGLYDELGGNTVNQQVEGVNRVFHLVDVCTDDVEPAVLGVFHHGGILFCQTAVGQGDCIVFVLIVVAALFIGVELPTGDLKLAHELVLLFHQILDLLADVHDDGFISPVTFRLVPVELGRIFFLALGSDGGGDADAGVGTEVDVGVEVIVVDIGDKQRPLPDGAAADVDGHQDLFFEDSLHFDDQLVALFTLDLDGEVHDQLDADTLQGFLAVLEVCQVADLDVGLDALVDVGCDLHQLHVFGINGAAVVEGDGIGGEVHIQIVAQLLETVGLKGQGGQVFGRFVEEAAFGDLLKDVGFHSGDLRLVHLDFFIACAVDIHRFHDFVHGGCRIGDDILAAVELDVVNADIVGNGTAAALDAAAGVEGDIVADVGRGVAVQIHLGIHGIGVVQIGCIDGDAAFDAVVACLIGNGQDVGTEQDVFGIGGAIAEYVAVLAGDLNINDRFVLALIITQVGACALVDGNGIADGDVAAVIGKGALILVLCNDASAVIGDREGKQTFRCRAGHIAYINAGQILQAVVQGQVLNLALFGDDVQNTDVEGLFFTVHNKYGTRAVLQLDAVGLALGISGCDIFADDRIVYGAVQVGDVVEVFHILLAAAADLKDIAVDLIGGNGDGDVVGGLRCGNGGIFAHLRIECAAAIQGVVLADGSGHFLVVIPAQEQAALLLGGGQQRDLCVLGEGIGFGQGDACGILTLAHGKRNLIIVGCAAA